MRGLNTKMQSIEEMAKKEYEKEMCVFKAACAMAKDQCYVCDGFDYNCESYEIQLECKKIKDGLYDDY